MQDNEPDAKDRIIKTAMEMLEAETDASKITVRRIAEKAGVGIGLINYHFGSKEKLLNEAVNVTMTEMADKLGEFNSSNTAPPIDKLKTMLRQLSDFAMHYYKLTQISVAYELQQGDMQVPLYLLPALREFYGREKDEWELRLLAFTIVTTMQAIYLRRDTFKRYSGIDIFDEKQRNEAIDRLIENIIKK